jgi:transcriptional regulator with XRE-family HTH domain
MNIGLKIRNIRMQKGYSQEYMAEFLNVSQKTYSHIENEKIKIHLARLSKIAEVFDLSLVQIIETEDQANNLRFDNTKWNIALLNFNKQIEELREEIRLLRLERTFL